MIKKILTLIAIVMVNQFLISQSKESCENPVEDPLLELNSISKCSVEENIEKSSKNSLAKNSKQVKLQVSTRRRVVRKRDAVTGISNSGTSHKIASIKERASLVGSLDLSNKETLENVPFNIVEEIPLFKECEKVPYSEQEKCFKEQISDHVRKNFNYPNEAYEESIQGRVYVQFVIDKSGAVTDLRLRGPYKGDLLEKEAERIVEKLPQFKPGKHNGRAVKVKYGIPINFRIPGKKPSNIKNSLPKAEINNSNLINFTSVEQIPTFKICALLNDTSADCFNREIIKHVSKNFKYPKEALKKRIEGSITVYFVVDKNGNVTNIKTTGPEGTDVLQYASKRLFEKLPAMVPGRQKGIPINVKHSFPLDFKL